MFVTAASRVKRATVFAVQVRNLCAVSTENIVPIISLKPFYEGGEAGKKHVAKQLGDAAEYVGFFTITDHRVPQKTIDHMWSATRAFFDLPDDVKRKYVSHNEAEYPYGYNPFGSEVLSAGKAAEEGKLDAMTPDLKECYSMGPYNPLSGMPAPRLPTAPADMATAWLTYYKEMERLSTDMLQVMALALNLPQNWFADKIDRHRCALRALNYPDLVKPPAPGQSRASAHTDYGTITILRPDDAPGGLQVKGRDGAWHDVPYLPDAYVINLGDLMSRWTNDKWVSTLHRVVTPPLDAKRSCRRQSVAFFHNINPDYEVRCIDTCVNMYHPCKYEPVKAFDFLMQKHLASLGQKYK